MGSRKTNVEVLTELMQFSRYGALAQVFVIDAIQKQARLAAAADPKKIDSPVVTGRAWVGVAIEIRDALDQHYGATVTSTMSPRKVMLFAALLAASEAYVDDFEVDTTRLATPGGGYQPYLTTFGGELISMNDQQIELVDEEAGSRGAFLDVDGTRHDLLLHQLVRLPVQIVERCGLSLQGEVA